MDTTELLSQVEAEARVSAQRFVESHAAMDDTAFVLHNVDAGLANGTNSLNAQMFDALERGEHLNDSFLKHASSL